MADKRAANGGTEYVPIPLDGETIARLARLERATGTPAAKIAASMLHDVLNDDEFFEEDIALLGGSKH